MNQNVQLVVGQNRTELENIAKHNAITFIGLFGSFARGEQTDKSDIDLLIKFDFSEKRFGLFGLYRIQKQIEKVFGREVDVVTKPNKYIKSYIEKDLITLYERR